MQVGQITEEVEEERQPLVPLQETSEQGLNTVHQGGGNSPDPSALLSLEQVPGSAPRAPSAGRGLAGRPRGWGCLKLGRRGASFVVEHRL